MVREDVPESFEMHSESHPCGIEIRCAGREPQDAVALNRTLVVLKLDVEALKVGIKRASESHPCGIEIMASSRAFRAACRL